MGFAFRVWGSKPWNASGAVCNRAAVSAESGLVGVRFSIPVIWPRTICFLWRLVLQSFWPAANRAAGPGRKVNETELEHNR